MFAKMIQSGLVILASLFLFAGHLSAATVDEEWPCVQVLIPELALAVMWPEPLPDSQQGQWRQYPEISQPSNTLGDLEADTDREEQLIEDFVSAQSAENLPAALNYLADGVVSVANNLRSKYISGIKRYTRQQISIAGQIEKSLNQLAVMVNETSLARSELEESLKWHEWVYDQRERAIASRQQ